jgi:phospholipase/lecithinase/hemolysin
MKMSSFTFSISYSTIFTFCITIYIISTVSLASAPADQPFKKVYVFGDSYTDTGNNNNSNGPGIFRHVSNLPYGRTFFHHPTNRYSDGRLVIDYVAEYLNLPYFPPYRNKSADTTHGINFAVGGCTVIPYSYFLKINATFDTVPESLVPTQLTWFKDHIKGSGCKDAISTPKECKAVFDGALVWIGEMSANDYNYLYKTKTVSKNLQKLAIWYETKFIKDILKMGAKYIVVQGLPTTGCFPMAFISNAPTDRDEIGCVASKNKESYDHNMILQAKLHSLRKKFPSSVIVYGDDWHAYREVYKNPTKYGFTERFKACCGSGGDYNFNMMATCGSSEATSCKHPSRYMNWDGLHVTTELNRVVSKLFLDGGFAQPTFPYLLKKAAESRV